jgi:hypothetical protein
MEKNFRVVSWIDIKDRLPDPWKRVLVWDGLDMEVTSRSVPINSRIWTNGNTLITHWMELPEPPEEEQ